MDEPTRRTWSKPELIVLVRSGPEEAVLESCKSEATGTWAGHDLFFNGCHIVVCGTNCAPHVSS
ncbi:MAG: hypothetical protein WCP98_22750 [Actinomycetes bacterium]